MRASRGRDILCACEAKARLPDTGPQTNSHCAYFLSCSCRADRGPQATNQSPPCADPRNGVVSTWSTEHGTQRKNEEKNEGRRNKKEARGSKRDGIDLAHDYQHTLRFDKFCGRSHGPPEKKAWTTPLVNWGRAASCHCVRDRRAGCCGLASTRRTNTVVGHGLLLALGAWMLIRSG